MRVGPRKAGSPGAHSYTKRLSYIESNLSFQAPAPAPAAPQRYTEQRSLSMTSSARGFTLRALPRPTRAPREPVTRDRRLRLSPGPRAQRHGAGRDPARASAAYLARAPALPLRLRVLLSGRRLGIAARIRCGARATAAAEGPAPLSRPCAPRPYAASAGPAPSALASGAAAARPLPSRGGGGDLARTRPSFPAAAHQGAGLTAPPGEHPKAGDTQGRALTLHLGLCEICVLQTRGAEPDSYKRLGLEHRHRDHSSPCNHLS